MNRYVLYSDPEAPPFEILFDTMEAALAAKERIREADRAEFERQ
jgi:hypothetical protein